MGGCKRSHYLLLATQLAVSPLAISYGSHPDGVTRGALLFLYVRTPSVSTHRLAPSEASRTLEQTVGSGASEESVRKVLSARKRCSTLYTFATINLVVVGV